MKRRYFVFDTEKCIGCFNCLHACKDEHVGNDFSPVTLPQKLHRQYWLTTTEKVRGLFPMIDVAYLTEPCGHCENAPCLGAGNGAVIRREDGIILIDPEKAKGAGDLTAACPFGRISYNEEQEVSQKCTLCAHLLDEGWEQPRCAQACPLGALKMEYTEPETMEERFASGELSRLGERYSSCGSTLYIKNLHRWNTLFLGGKVTAPTGGVDMCVEGCSVTLNQNGTQIQSRVTDAYGEFKLDRLLPGEYSISLRMEGFLPHSVSATLEKSTYLGKFALTRDI